jgi:hypothetical protein
VTDLTIPRWVSIRDPRTGQRYKPAVARVRADELIVWAQVGRVVERVLTVGIDSVKDATSFLDAEGHVWQIEAARCGCGAKALKVYDPDRDDPV